MAKPTVISSDSKIPVKDIAYIVVFTLFLASIKSEIRELRLKIDGRLNLYEYRLAQLETAIPTKAKAAPMSAATTPRPLSNISDIHDEED